MNLLRVLRAEKRITQFDLRLSTGIHQSKISLIENGLIAPDEDEKRKIAKVLGVKPEEIWRKNGAGSPASIPSGPRVVERGEWTDKELAAFLKVKVGTIHSWLSRGVELPPFVRIGSVTRWSESSVREWLREKERTRKERNFEA